MKRQECFSSRGMTAGCNWSSFVLRGGSSSTRRAKGAEAARNVSKEKKCDWKKEGN